MPHGVAIRPNCSSGNPRQLNNAACGTSGQTRPADSGDAICRVFGGRLGSVANLRRAAAAGAEWPQWAVAKDPRAGHTSPGR